MKTALAEFVNEDLGMSAKVFEGAKGYNAVLKDDDCGETVIVKIYPALTDAIAEAKRLVG